MKTSCVFVFVFAAVVAGSVGCHGDSVVSNAGVSIPNVVVDELLKAIEPKIDQAINGIQLPTCCYDDVGVKHVHLNFQQLSIVNTRVGLNVNTSASTDQLIIEASIQLTLQGFYRLCIHDDPFGKGCSTLDKCKGDFSITPSLSATLAFTPIVESTNTLLVNGTVAGFRVLSLNNNFCSWFQKGIQAAEPDIIKAGTKALGEVAASIAASLTRAANSHINTTTARVDWLFSNETRNTRAGAAVLLDVMLITPSGVKAPAKQTAQPPLTQLTDNDIHVVLGDSLLSNSLFVLAEDGVLDFAFNVVIANQTVPINISFSDASDVRFKSGAAVDLNTTVAFPLLGKTITANAVLTAAVTLNVTQTAAHTFNVTVHATEATLSSIGQCSDKATCKVLQAVKEYLDKHGAALVNEVLAKVPIAVSNQHVSDLRAIVRDSYADIAVGVDFSSLADTAVAALHAHITSTADGAGGIQCPQIPGAHQDGCI
ncbi:hypothetical protein PTSG_08695 [Salpingoeca rosetta]|uniref:Lipid-binding serum glycoprotein N-terminal domain-containing protein n=1 Tax=Salpingoeca rosetta (strain ATCC 50818 / BSB-021) TaxID=946362 RepID=F2UKE9_SALR5|nr:uncharacterized protein PTSG_08695 [Salpingoeca rosetta]EGD77598.1 hypothetical protein PTSG_08695 [Salpingoeca rosetta]|eukprot:XP_004990486.1 hypothetical protein PTSG_08695 [Salpingoeca rosetta]